LDRAGLDVRDRLAYRGNAMSTMPTRPVVIQLVNSLALAGAEHVAVSLATHLDPGRWDVRMIVVRDGPLRSSLDEAGIPVTVIGYDFDHRFPLVVRELARHFREHRPDVLHTHLIGSDIVGRLAATVSDVPVVVSTQHDVYQRAWYYDSFRRFTGSRISATVACSSAVEDYCRTVLRIPEDRLFHIDNGVDTSSFERSRMPLRAPATFGSVGSLIEAKGHDVLVRALATIADELPGSRVLVAGDGVERERLSRLAVELGVDDRFHMMGTVEDIAGFLRNVDVFVHPSYTEGLSMALLEAMAAHKPVIASDVGALRELLDGGRCGRLVPPGDPAVLGETMALLATDNYVAESLADSAATWVEEHYSLAREVEEYARLYGRLLEEAGRSSTDVPVAARR
jgi:glycosyltransferase involved in cell wall biosynthesis